MRIITRYLLRSFLGPLVICLVAFNSLFLVFDLFDNVSQFIEADTPISYILRYYAGMICIYSHWFAPASLMLATLYTMWMLSRNSEITAMRASGISFTRISMPFFGTALVMTALIAANSELVVPDTAAWLSRFKESKFDIASADSDIRLQFPFYNSAGHRKWVFEKIDLSSEKTVSHVTAPVSITQERGEGDFAGVSEWTILADGADFLDGGWWLVNPRRVDYNEYGEEKPAAVTPLGAVSYLWMVGFDEVPRDIMLMGGRNWDTFSTSDMKRVLRQSGGGKQDLPRIFDMQYRFAAPWACFVITLFAVPAGLTTARQSVLRGVLVALAAFFSFYALTQFATFFGKQGVIPVFMAVWLPNALFFTIGTRLYIKLT